MASCPIQGPTPGRPRKRQSPKADPATPGVASIGSFWPYGTTLWSYIRRPQLVDEPGSLTPDQVYAVTVPPLPERDHRRARGPRRALAARGPDAEPRRVRDGSSP